MQPSPIVSDFIPFNNPPSNLTEHFKRCVSIGRLIVPPFKLNINY